MRRRHRPALAAPAALAFAWLALPASSQSPVHGVDLLGGRMFATTTDDFVANYTPVAPAGGTLYALDYDATATTLYAIDDTTREVSIIDVNAGTVTPTGSIVSGPTAGITGLTADPNGTDWWLCEWDGFTNPSESRLYRGDITTGAFTLVGTIMASNNSLLIDISMDSQGNLFGLDLADELVQIDPATGAGFVVGPIGWNANFAQGMDFDWSTDALYATIFSGGGTGAGVFVEIDTATGFGAFLENTTPTMAEMEIAIQAVPGGAGQGIGASYCVTNPNSTGNPAAISASGSTAVADNDVTLTASDMPPMQFGIFVTSLTQAQVPLGDGNLCVGGTIGRYQGPGLIQQVDMNGEFSLTIDITAIPQGGVAVGAQPGDSWNFQAWFRDVTMTGPTSNLTNGIEITFN